MPRNPTVDHAPSIIEVASDATQTAHCVSKGRILHDYGQAHAFSMPRGTEASQKSLAPTVTLVITVGASLLITVAARNCERKRQKHDPVNHQSRVMSEWTMHSTTSLSR